nr:probable membrane-associated kinase regulator 1 [Ipomoea batatas]
METRRRNSNSGDKFSFPIIMPVHEQQDGEFEFGCVSTSPGSPNSPADRLFFNGKLLPHDFPCPPPASGFSYSRSTSRASSVSSKDSLIHSGRPVPGSQRWQFMATPAALVDRRKNHRHGTAGARNQEPKLRKQGDDGEKLINKTAGKSSFGLRILRSFFGEVMTAGAEGIGLGPQLKSGAGGRIEIEGCFKGTVEEGEVLRFEENSWDR